MSDKRHKNVDWQISPDPMTGNVSYDGAQLAVLMDLRDELQALNQKLAGVGPTVHQIEQNTRGGRRCPRCGRGPYKTSRGLIAHDRRVHA